MNNVKWYINNAFSCYNFTVMFVISTSNMQIIILYLPEDKMVVNFVSNKLCESFMCLKCFQMIIVPCVHNHFLQFTFSPQLTPFLLGPFKKEFYCTSIWMVMLTECHILDIKRVQGLLLQTHCTSSYSVKLSSSVGILVTFVNKSLLMFISV
jgi:hypothetical protein